MSQTQPITISYTNWRGETRERHIAPLTLWYGVSEWHDGPQWFIRAIDMDSGDERDFALSGFKGGAA